MTDPAASKSVHSGLVMFALAMGGFAIGTTEFASMALVPYFARGLHIDEPTAGHVISAYALGVVVGAPLMAVIGAKFARRTQLIALMLWFALGNGLSAIAPGYGWLIAFRFLAGLPHGAYFGIAALVATGLVPANRRAKAIGQIFLGLTAATVMRPRHPARGGGRGAGPGRHTAQQHRVRRGRPGRAAAAAAGGGAADRHPAGHPRVPRRRPPLAGRARRRHPRPPRRQADQEPLPRPRPPPPPATISV